MDRIGKWALHYGRSRQALVEIAPDDVHQGMWRIVWPNGSISDMVNLSRAKDAAMALAEHGSPSRNRRLFHWKLEPSKTPAEAPPIAPIECPATPMLRPPDGYA